MSSALLASMSEFRRLLEKGEGSTLDWDIYSLEAFSLLSHRVWDCRAGVWDSPLRCRVLVSHLLPGKYQIETCAASSIRVHCWCLPTPSAVNYSTAKDQTSERLSLHPLLHWGSLRQLTYAIQNPYKIHKQALKSHNLRKTVMRRLKSLAAIISVSALKSPVRPHTHKSNYTLQETTWPTDLTQDRHSLTSVWNLVKSGC
jgi:hypothetical protein